MEAGLHEWPLVFFTVIGQTVVGAFLLLAFALISVGERYHRHRIYRGIFFLLVLMGLGFAASFFHLGSPLRAVNALNKVGSSMLSNEIACGSVFAVLLFAGWFSHLMGVLTPVMERIWLIATALCGVLFLYVMNRVYHIPTVPAWDNLWTTLSFYLTALVSGGALGYVILHMSLKQYDNLSWILWLVGAGILLTVLVVFYQYATVQAVHASFRDMTQLLRAYPALSALAIAGLALALLLLFIHNGKMTAWSAYGIAAAVLVLGSEMLLRVLFYASHTTVGMA